MMKIVPSSKDDLKSVENLRVASKQEILAHSKELLEWLQDGNWPVAEGVSEVLKNYTNEVRRDIVEILSGNDGMWKYWVILNLIFYADGINELHKELVKELHRISSFPTQDDINSDVYEIALESLERLKGG